MAVWLVWISEIEMGIVEVKDIVYLQVLLNVLAGQLRTTVLVASEKLRRSPAAIATEQETRTKISSVSLDSAIMALSHGPPMIPYLES